jgi:hypothetical protein
MVMKSIELLALGLRLLGIYGLMKGVQQLALSFTYIQQVSAPIYDGSLLIVYVAYGAATALVFLLSFLLLKFPISVAKWLMPRTSGDGVVFNGSAEDIQIAAFIVLGIYILSWSIPDFFHNAALLWMAQEADYSAGDKTNILTNEIVTVIEMGIGLYLCLQAHGLNALLRKLRGLD